MDAALIRERTAFKKRALAMPVIEKKRSVTNDNLDRPRKKPKLSNRGEHCILKLIFNIPYYSFIYIYIPIGDQINFTQLYMYIYL